MSTPVNSEPAAATTRQERRAPPSSGPQELAISPRAIAGDVPTFLQHNNLGQYTEAFHELGFDAVEDLRTLVDRNAAEFVRVVPSVGHQIKFCRLLGVAYSPTSQLEVSREDGGSDRKKGRHEAVLVDLDHFQHQFIAALSSPPASRVHALCGLIGYVAQPLPTTRNSTALSPSAAMFAVIPLRDVKVGIDSVLKLLKQQREALGARTFASDDLPPGPGQH